MHLVNLAMGYKLSCLRLIYMLQFVGPICGPRHESACVNGDATPAQLQFDKSADSEKYVTASQIFACRARF